MNRAQRREDERRRRSRAVSNKRKGKTQMGVYGDYLDRQLNLAQVEQERKRQLQRLSTLRKTDVLVYAADLNKPRAPINIQYDDLLPINDQLSNMSGESIDIILETPGGSGEVAEDIVRLVRGKYRKVSVIVPGCAKSAGTLIAMAADEILMEPASALGPIDAQLSIQGKMPFSAHALLQKLDEIKSEVERTGTLNKAWIPILQMISPGELQHAENALKFSQELVTDWLAKYKFQDWDVHKSTGVSVTDEERRARAAEIAQKLCDHGQWLTHGRSLKIQDLEAMRLRITDYSADADLADTIRRYSALMRITFDTNIYKLFETPSSQIVKFAVVQQLPVAGNPVDAEKAVLNHTCPKCNTVQPVQANLGKAQPLDKGCVAFPKDNKLKCPKCGDIDDLTANRLDIQRQTGKLIV